MEQNNELLTSTARLVACLRLSSGLDLGCGTRTGAEHWRLMDHGATPPAELFKGTETAAMALSFNGIALVSMDTISSAVMCARKSSAFAVCMASQRLEGTRGDMA